VVSSSQYVRQEPSIAVILTNVATLVIIVPDMDAHRWALSNVADTIVTRDSNAHVPAGVSPPVLSIAVAIFVSPDRDAEQIIALVLPMTILIAGVIIAAKEKNVPSAVRRASRKVQLTAERRSRRPVTREAYAGLLPRIFPA
jgi:hypothetical protein